MRKVMSSVLAVAMTLAAGSAFGRSVSTSEAKEAAANFLTAHTDLGTVKASDLSLVYTIDNEKLGIPATFAFNNAGGGWIIMSANTLTSPVVGYSNCDNLELGNIPTPMALLIEDYARYVTEVQLQELDGTYDDREEWTALLNGEMHPSKADNETILLDEKWDQNGDNWGMANGTSYDIYTPIINGKHAPVGCVATAISQIMHFYQFPVYPKGKVSYSVQQTETYAQGSYSLKFDTITFDYSKMPMRITSSTPQEERKEIAKLCYAAGIAVRMGYGSEASGAQSSVVPSAMKTYFKYMRGTMHYRRSSINNERYLNYEPYASSVDDSTFMSALRSDLMEGHPIYMGGVSSSGSGRDAGGHAWVCDGYNTENLNRYHMNWGWGSVGNGWFLLRDNTYNGMKISQTGYCFNVMQECITGMYPDPDKVGIEEADATVEVMPAYPNPATSSVMLPYSSTAEVDLVVYGMDGRIVEQRRVPAGGVNAEVRVDKMPAGVYTYRIGAATGKFIVK